MLRLTIPSYWKYLVAGFAAFFVAASITTLARAAVVPPELPRVYVDTTMPVLTGGTTINVPAGDATAFQNALNQAQRGDTIILAAGSTYTGNFTVPAKSGSGWIIIKTSNMSGIPAEGVRVNPTLHKNAMPKIVSPNQQPALLFLPDADNYRLIGLEVATTWASTADTHWNLISMGTDANGVETTNVAQLPNNLVFDRVYVHGTPTGNVRRGFLAHSQAFALIDSHVSDFHEIGADSQAFGSFSAAGPFKIVNNYLEGAGENLMFGGSDTPISQLTPSDIEIRNNYFFKPFSWKIGHPQYAGKAWTIKNLFELKHAQRVLVEGNVFENNWLHAQNGFAILLTVRNQDGGNTWAKVWDVTIRKNILRNTASGFNISGSDDNRPSQITRRIAIHDNLIYNVDQTTFGGDGRIFQVVAGANKAVEHLRIEHNTGLHRAVGGNSNFMATGDVGVIASSTNFDNNLVTRGNYGFFGSGAGEGTSALTTFWRNYTFAKNGIIVFPTPPTNDPFNPGTYPTGTLFASSTAAAGFVNFSANDYRLSATSPFNNAGTDGKDIGADIDAVLLATATAVSGNNSGGNPPPPPPNQPPVISLFSANPTSILRGSSSVLSWTVSGASSLSMAPSVGSLSSSSVSASVSPTVTTLYTLSATNAAGTTRATTTLTVSTTPNPTSTTDITPPRISLVRFRTGSESSSVSFSTSENATARLYYVSRLTKPVKSLSSPVTPGTSFSFDLQNLIPGRSYLTQIVATDTNTNETFSTLYTLRTRAYPSLRLGSQSPYVTRLQQLLTQLTYYTGTPSGVFDQTTKTAVETFQKDKKIANTIQQGLGIVGPLTWNRLFEEVGRE